MAAFPSELADTPFTADIDIAIPTDIMGMILTIAAGPITNPTTTKDTTVLNGATLSGGTVIQGGIIGAIDFMGNAVMDHGGITSAGDIVLAMPVAGGAGGDTGAIGATVVAGAEVAGGDRPVSPVIL